MIDCLIIFTFSLLDLILSNDIRTYQYLSFIKVDEKVEDIFLILRGNSIYRLFFAPYGNLTSRNIG